jgi:hypothetical protein
MWLGTKMSAPRWSAIFSNLRMMNASAPIFVVAVSNGNKLRRQ